MDKAQETENVVIPLPKERALTAIIGEHNEVKAYMVRPYKSQLGVNWVAVYQEALEWLAKQNLPNEQYRVMMYLMSKLDWENYVRVTQTSIADGLHIAQGNVSKAMKGLLRNGVLIEGPRSGSAKTYRLNPRMAYKGKNPRETIIQFDAAMAKKKAEAEAKKTE